MSFDSAISDYNQSKHTFGLLGASLGTGNRGVSALSASVLKLSKEAIPGADGFLLIGNRDSKPMSVSLAGKSKMIPVVHYRQSLKSHPKHHIFGIVLLSLAYRILPINSVRRLIADYCPWIKAVTEAGFIGEIRGGDSFSDIYGMKRFLLGSLPVLSVILLRGQVVLLPQTYGPYKSRISRMVARFILRRSSVILSRDQEGLRMVGDLIGKTDRCRYCPDVAFSLEPVRPANPAIVPPIPSTIGEILVGVNVNGLMFNGGYTRSNMFGLRMDYRSFVVELVRGLLEQKNIRVLLVPHTFAPDGNAESDPEACRNVLATAPPEWKDRVHLVTAEYDQHEIKGVIGMCDFFVGSRMHACIAALSQGIPTVGVAYSKKFLGVFTSVDMADWVVDGREVTNEDAQARIRSLLGQRQEIRSRLSAKVHEVQQFQKEVFREMLRS